MRRNRAVTFAYRGFARYRKDVLLAAWNMVVRLA